MAELLSGQAAWGHREVVKKGAEIRRMLSSATVAAVLRQTTEGQEEEQEGRQQPRRCTGAAADCPAAHMRCGRASPGTPPRLPAVASGRVQTASTRGRPTEAKRAASARTHCVWDVCKTPRRRQTLSWMCVSRDQEGGLSWRDQRLSRTQKRPRTAKPWQVQPSGPSEVARCMGPHKRPSSAVT